ncbi:hypothetical protein BDZ94DRAFT_1316582 [Collybia nuda]|uniref:Uncharacterized protein n=1 Tax=Collybia nuda TaxID=64659 RepID=A0A9P5XTJ5_9AGAR|nr:hypothetical protein BDZ94DRAFT_1316582 [Collybia nuda]
MDIVPSTPGISNPASTAGSPVSSQGLSPVPSKEALADFTTPGVPDLPGISSFHSPVPFPSCQHPMPFAVPVPRSSLEEQDWLGMSDSSRNTLAQPAEQGNIESPLLSLPPSFASG